MANWEHCPAVERARDGTASVWVFRGTDVPLHALYEHLASGATLVDFAGQFGLDVERAAAALEYEADELHDYRLDYSGPVPYARNSYADGYRPGDAVWRNCSLVEQATGRLGGAWVFKHTRLPLYVLHCHLAGGSTLDEFDEWFDMDTTKASAVLQHQANELLKDGLGNAHIV